MLLEAIRNNRKASSRLLEQPFERRSPCILQTQSFSVQAAVLAWFL